MMRRRDFLATPMLLHRAQARQPNIVLILADDMGSADLSSYGATGIRTAPHGLHRQARRLACGEACPLGTRSPGSAFERLLFAMTRPLSA